VTSQQSMTIHVVLHDVILCEINWWRFVA